MDDTFQLEQESLPASRQTGKVNRSKMRTMILEKLASRPQWPLTDLVAELGAGAKGTSYIYRRIAALKGIDLEIIKAGTTNWVLSKASVTSHQSTPQKVTVKVKVIISNDRKTITVVHPKRGPKPSRTTTGTLTYFTSF